MSKRAFSGLGLLLVLLLAACNLNTAPNNASVPITGAPGVQIVSPLPNATYLEGVPVNIQALVTNAGADLDRVDISVDDTIVSSLTAPNEAGTPSFSIAETWPAAGAGAHTITIVASRSDGTASPPASVTISVVSQVVQPQTQPTQSSGSSNSTTNGGDQSNTSTDGSQAQPTAKPTDVPQPTEPPPPTNTPTPDKPMANFTTGVNVRRGPDTLFNPPIGSYAAGDSAEVLAVNSARTWYKVRYYNSEGWVFGNLLTVSGNADSLAIDEGPPKPTLTPTPVPATATPQIKVNLVAGNITTDPSDKACGKTFKIYIDIANFGETRSPSGSIAIEDSAKGSVTRTTGSFPEIDPGKTINVGPIPLTVDTNFGVEHTLALILDPNNSIPETNEGDNRGERKYTLSKGDC
ncbi:MAG: SH3 domain-containing protein [Anaerolineae bacterium]|nr:SH3 domain-containing protein [Anaerolineae bacterium]